MKNNINFQIVRNNKPVGKTPIGKPLKWLWDSWQSTYQGSPGVNQHESSNMLLQKEEEVAHWFCSENVG